MVLPRVAWAQGNPVGPEFRVNTYATADEYHPPVASDPSGNFVVVWESDTQDGYGIGVFGQRYAASGTALGTEFRVNTYVTTNQARPSVSTDQFGDFVVVWIDPSQDGSGYGVFGQRYASSGAPLGPEFRVNTYTTYSQVYPAVSARPSGDFIVVWESAIQDGSTAGVFGQRYGPIVPVDLSHFAVE
jgi:hypothetical protein